MNCRVPIVSPPMNRISGSQRDVNARLPEWVAELCLKILWRGAFARTCHRDMPRKP
jgi:hypothetical protein